MKEETKKYEFVRFNYVGHSDILNFIKTELEKY